MTTLREAAQQALEALELYVPKEDYENRPVGNVIDALRAALAEPVQDHFPDATKMVQEPVAWIEHERAGTGLRKLHFEKRDPTVRDEVVNPVWTPLYTAPPQRPAEPVQEPVTAAWDGRCMLGHCNSPAGCENSGECRAIERAHKIGGQP